MPPKLSSKRSTFLSFQPPAVGDEEVAARDRYRYPGPKPQSREAAILMLADGVEASVRSLEEKDEVSIRTMVDRIVDAGKPHNIRPIAPCEARRIEAGIFNYGSDMTIDNNPFEVMGLERLVEPQAADYIGKTALAEIKQRGERVLVGGHRRTLAAGAALIFTLFAAGAVLGWWAALLPPALVLASVPAGYGAAMDGEEFPIWFGVGGR